MKKAILSVLIIMSSTLFSQLFNNYRGMGLSINTSQNLYLDNIWFADEFGVSGASSFFLYFNPI